MKIIQVTTKEEQKRYLTFRREIYKHHPYFVDNDLFMIKELFAGNTSFTKNKEVEVVYVEENNEVLCQGMIVYTQKLKEYIQLCFFESKPHVEEAVQLLIEKAMEIGRRYECKRLVIGLNGHVNYGLGFLASHYEQRNSFSASANPKYYHEYFKNMNCEEINLNTYRIECIDDRLERYDGLLRKIDRQYTFRYFDKKKFKEDAKIYTDLNNQCFGQHRYYYERTYEEDVEMLKELFLFMKEDSLIFAFDENIPVAFIMWYPDFNELVKPGDAFGAKHYIKNLFCHGSIQTAKVMEYGVIEEYRKIGLPLALIHQIFMTLKHYAMTKAETSWILEENLDSNSFCQEICDHKYKRYIVYEKEI